MNKEKQKGDDIVERILAGEKKWSGEEFDNRDDFEKYQKIWLASKKVAHNRQFNQDNSWQEVDSKIQKGNSRRLLFSKITYAASGIAATLIILASLNFFFNIPDLNGKLMAASTEYGNRSNVILPDGTEVSLNAGTNIQFSFDRLNKSRKVHFSGEGYFKVSRSSYPFIVETPDGIKIKVLGTVFNLAAYSDEAELYTTLVEGSVEMIDPRGQTLLMIPGQIACYSKTSGELSLVNGNPNHNCGWLDDKIYLYNTTLTATARILERRYGVSIKISPASLGEEIPYTGVLEEESIIDVLEALKHLSEINYIISGKEITITYK